MSESELGIININSVLRDDELRLVLWKLEQEESKQVFSLVCKRWLRIQSSDRVRLCARAGPHMLLRLGNRFTRLSHLDLSQSCSRSFYPGLTDYDLQVISTHFSELRKLFLQNCTGTNINSVLRDEELRLILYKLEQEEAKGVFSLVCKHWLRIQSSDRVRLCARAGPHMLVRLWKRYIRLSHLDLSQSCSRSFYPGLTDDDVQVISTYFSELRKLFLQNCTGITDVGLAAIGCRLYSLHVLDVSNCKKLTDKGLVAVTEGCCELRGLYLAGCKTITDAVLRALSKNCHNLEELVLQGCFKITDVGLGVLAEGCQRIKHLNINKCSNIGDAGVASVSRACSISLKTLKLLDCSKIGDESILSVGRFCKSLETLVIGGCREISSGAIEQLASSSSRTLKNLRMDWCLNVSDSSLNCIFSHCKKLEVLDIGCCEEVTDFAFSGFSKNGFQMSLKILKISNCQKITVVGIRLVLEFCKFIEYIDVRSCPNITKASCDEAGLQFPDPCKVNFCGSSAEPDLLL